MSTRPILCLVIGLAAATLAASAQARNVPMFEATTMDGDDFRFADIVGKKVIVIDFWATYCIQCRPQLDALAKLYAKYKDEGLEVLIVSVDSPQNTGKIKPFFRSRGYEFPVLLDTDSQIARVLKPRPGLPYTVLIDRGGNIVYQHEGYKKGEEVTLEEKIKKCIEPPSDEISG